MSARGSSTTAVVALEVLSQLCCQGPLELRSAARVGGERGLFVTRAFKKGASIGPLAPLATSPATSEVMAQAATYEPRIRPVKPAVPPSKGPKPQVFAHKPKKAKKSKVAAQSPVQTNSTESESGKNGFLGQNAKPGDVRRFHSCVVLENKASGGGTVNEFQGLGIDGNFPGFQDQNEQPKALCPTCLAPKDEVPMCPYCNSPDRSIRDREELVKKMLRNLHSINNDVDLEEMDPNQRFPLITQSILLRIIADEITLGTVDTLVTLWSFMRPDLGPGTEAAWENDWKITKSRIERACTRTGIDLGTVTFWSGPPERQDLGDAREAFMASMAALHINSIRTPVCSALYPTLGFANHSCDPSVDLAFNGALAYLVPRRDLKPGDEVTFHYAGSRELEQSQLQKFLAWNYGFECKVDCGCAVRLQEQPDSDPNQSPPPPPVL